MVCPSLESAVESLQSPPLSDKIESVFVLGGARVYEVRVMRGAPNSTSKIQCNNISFPATHDIQLTPNNNYAVLYY
jgi:hypothetical protein